MSIELSNESGVDVDLDALHGVVRFAFEQLRVNREADLAIMAVDENTMEQLHVQWMDEPGPTDVLSFPMDELRPPKPSDEPVSGVLGDIVLCPTVAAKQAHEAGHSVEAELELLTIHGLLHLLGFDHAEPEDEREMFGLQNRLLADYRAGRATA